jgi:hypothetical protein
MAINSKLLAVAAVVLLVLGGCERKAEVEPMAPGAEVTPPPEAPPAGMTAPEVAPPAAPATGER